MVLLLTSVTNLVDAGKDLGLNVAAVVAFDREEAADAVRELGEGDEGKLQRVQRQLLQVEQQDMKESWG